MGGAASEPIPPRADFAAIGWTAEYVRERLQDTQREYAWLARYGHVSPVEARKLTIAERRRLRMALSDLIDEENQAMEAARRHD